MLSHLYVEDKGARTGEVENRVTAERWGWEGHIRKAKVLTRGTEHT